MKDLAQRIEKLATAIEKKAYQFYGDDILAILRDVSEQVGFDAESQRNFRRMNEQAVYTTLTGWKIWFKGWVNDSDDWEVDVPELGEPEMFVQNPEGKKYKVLPSKAEPLYRMMGIRQKHY